MTLTDQEYRDARVNQLAADAIANEDKFLIFPSSTGELPPELDVTALAEWAFEHLERQMANVLEAIDSVLDEACNE